MLRRVPPAVLYCAVAAVCFFVGVRIEPALTGRGREHAAEARALASTAALRLGKPVAPEPVLRHDEAIQASVAQPEAPAPTAPAVAEIPPEPDANPKPTTITGRDPETGSEFVEMKDLPEVQGQGGLDPEPARDVDVIGEQGVPVPDPDPGTAKPAAK